MKSFACVSQDKLNVAICLSPSYLFLHQCRFYSSFNSRTVALLYAFKRICRGLKHKLHTIWAYNLELISRIALDERKQYLASRSLHNRNRIGTESHQPVSCVLGPNQIKRERDGRTAVVGWSARVCCIWEHLTAAVVQCVSSVTEC
jgi:hypothetical protein